VPRWMKHRTARWMTTEGLGISAPLPWTGATWALTGGRAFNTPTLGAENIVDPGFENWNSTTDSTSWTESIAGSSTITRDTDARSGTYALRMTVDSGNNTVAASNSVGVTSGLWYQFGVWAKRVSATATVRFGIDNNFSPTFSATATYAQYLRTLRTGSTSGFGIIRLAANDIILFDDAWCKPLTLATLPATVTTVAGQTVTAKPYAITIGTQAGVISHLDSAVSPANFIIAYHDGGTSIRMDKCVGGTYTSLVSATTGFVSDAVIEIRALGSNQFECWYNGTKRGLTATVSDAGIISNTRYGLFSTYSANQFSTGLTLGGVLIPFNLPGA